jgi:alkanesulfonate monooxygenase SsuD/methylene tetrahydromethanopterin reductase-like flavin-dependent oxidoreductase (luciferase family)
MDGGTTGARSRDGGGTQIRSLSTAPPSQLDPAPPIWMRISQHPSNARQATAILRQLFSVV